MLGLSVLGEGAGGFYDAGFVFLLLREGGVSVSGGIDRTGSSGFSLVRGLVLFFWGRSFVAIFWVLSRGTVGHGALIRWFL